MGFQIVIIEDDLLLAKYLSAIVAKYHRPFVAHNLEDAKKLIDNVKPDLVFTDLNLSPEVDYEGLDVISKCSEMAIPSVVLTSHEDHEVIKQAFERGCLHYLTKEDFETEVERIIKNTLGNPIAKYINDTLGTKSELFRSKIQYLLEQSENRTQTLLLTGETGVGKTFLAEKIHLYHDPENKTPFVAKNLTELSENLLESELFGHKKGAFTGATEDRKGWIEKANGGTLFLDEIGALPLNTQQKLLKVIEEKTLTPLGSTESIKVDFRLITATCENIEEKINNGDFRIDFYFRIKGHETTIPPLRERKEDIAATIENYIGSQKKKIFIDEEALTTLIEHSWPGNHRELLSVLNSLYSGRESFIKKESLNGLLHKGANSGVTLESLLTPKLQEEILQNGLPQTLSKLENEIFQRTLERLGKKPNKICDTLKISKSVFYRLQSQQ